MSHGKSTVFVGNIPYDATEEDLKAIFSRAGTVDSFRLVYDKETRQPKGYAFCDFADADSAMTAIKELSDVEINGRRLRLDLSDNALRGSGLRGGGPLALPAPEAAAAAASLASRPRVSMPPTLGAPGTNYPTLGLPAAPPPGPAPLAPPMPSGVVNPKPCGPSGGLPPLATADADDSSAVGGPEAMMANVAARTDIAQTIAAMPIAQLQLCLGTMQRLAVEAPERARALLQDNPQLCHALLHAQLLHGLALDPSYPALPEELQRLRGESMRGRGIGAGAGGFFPGPPLVGPMAPGMIPMGGAPPMDPRLFAQPMHLG